jgi:hypothetical protein
MLIRSSDLNDEIDALNAIYGENTVTVTFHNHHHTTIVLKLPDLTYGFLLQIPGTYPNSVPRVMGVDNLVQSRELGVQESATYLHACISGVYQPGSVCLYDAIDELAPMLDRQKQQRQYRSREDAMEVLTQQSMALRDLAVRARRRSLQFQDGIDDDFPGVSDCAACMEPFFKILMTHLQCQHSFCPDCLYGRPSPYSASLGALLTIDQLVEGILSALRGRTEFKCCGKSIPLREFRKISNLDDDFLDNYSKWLQELHCPNPLYCPWEKCSAFIPRFFVRQDFVGCPFCKRLLCMGCGGKGHQGVCANDGALQQMIKEGGWKFCPNCSHLVERVTGCNHMTCRCGSDFCYNCGEERDEWNVCDCEDYH